MKSSPIELLLRVAMATCVLMATALMAKAEDTPSRVQPSGRNVGEFITPEGRFDLEAARRSGYQGPLDMEGFATARDPVTGDLSFQRSASHEAASDPDDVYWDNSISPDTVTGQSGLNQSSICIPSSPPRICCPVHSFRIRPDRPYANRGAVKVSLGYNGRRYNIAHDKVVP